MSVGLRKIFLIFCSTKRAFKARPGPLETKFSDPKTVQFFKIISKVDALPHPDGSAPNIIFDNEIQVCLPPTGLMRIARTFILVTPIYQIIAKFISREIVSAAKFAFIKLEGQLLLFLSWGSSCLRNWAVIDVVDCATCSGVPQATTWPPPRPPSGPMSMT